MNKVKKIAVWAVFIFTFCFVSVGYAAVQDELIVNGIVSVDGYIIKDDLCAADTEGYIYDADTKTIEIKDIYYNSYDGKNYKVTGIAENGFLSEKIDEIKETDVNFTLDATKIESFILSESISQIGANAFNGLSNLKFFDTTKYNNTYFKFEDKILFKLEDDNKRTLVYYSFDKEATYYVVDETEITAITDGAFSNNEYCTAILTSYYDDNAWGSPAAVMISTVGFLDTVTNIEGNVADGYKVYLKQAEAGEAIVLQGNDDPDSNFYSDPQDVTIEADGIGSFITIESKLCKPCNDHGHYSQIYLSSWQTLAYGYFNEDKTLEIHNCLTAIVGGKIYQWVTDVDRSILRNDTLYNIPSGTVNGSKTLPSKFPTWNTIADQVKEVKVMDAIAPKSVSNWFTGMRRCTNMNLAMFNTAELDNMTGLFNDCTALLTLELGANFGDNGNCLSKQFNDSGLSEVALRWEPVNNSESVEIPTEDLPMGTPATYKAIFDYCYATLSGGTLYIYQRRVGEDIPTTNETFSDGNNTYAVEAIYSWRSGDTASNYTVCEGGRPLRTASGDAYSSWVAKAVNITVVKVVDEVEPLTLNCWFKMFQNVKSIDLEKLDTSKATSMNSMFYDCNKMTAFDLRHFSTENVTDMSHMFRSCIQLAELTLSDTFVTAEVTDMRYMFYHCLSLTELDLSSFDTAKVTNMSHMFDMSSSSAEEYIEYVTCLKKITVSDKFVIDNVTSSSKMFLNCTKLVGGNGTIFNSGYTGKTYARIDGANGQSGYFTGIVQIKIDESLENVVWSFNGTENLNADKESSIKLSTTDESELPASVKISLVTSDGTSSQNAQSVDIIDGIVTIPDAFMVKYGTVTISAADG